MRIPPLKMSERSRTVRSRSIRLFGWKFPVLEFLPEVLMRRLLFCEAVLMSVFVATWPINTLLGNVYIDDNSTQRKRLQAFYINITNVCVLVKNKCA
ncbi:hypothetical protein HMPREF9104_02609 [Lentilactobacillus kisonensis F0435]|uniref:Uncharacterized protein n=1 Tax=Lentilactobacillus kisonensis F0435 TaxID=797516 RepID=H1LJ16_9LACO|nr:hypothetical protein HMPREF9104_02609 [Lentilactobacillus kisonensis F0435]